MVSKWMIHCWRVPSWFAGVATIPQQQCQLVIALNALWKLSEPKRHCWGKLFILKQDVCIYHETTLILPPFSIGWLKIHCSLPPLPTVGSGWAKCINRKAAYTEKDGRMPQNGNLKNLSRCACQNLGLGLFFDKKKEKYCQQLSVALKAYVALLIHVYLEKVRNHTVYILCENTQQGYIRIKSEFLLGILAFDTVTVVTPNLSFSGIKTASYASWHLQQQANSSKQGTGTN